ncbi:MAG: glycosyltransferase [Candidatus Pacearchaeota archaeon]|nr:glycosyltransferase [Candidatus Pacearchaeota archaeon]
MNGLSLIIPAHNSGRVIENSLYRYYEAFSKKFKYFEMIVICNDCIDNTVSICKNLEKKLPIRTIEIPQRGKGYALIHGFNEARFDIMGFLDADNPFDLKKISVMIDRLDRVHIAIVSKYLKGNKKRQESISRRLVSLASSVVSKFFFNLPFADTQAGAKFFRKEVWDKINKNQKEFICKGFDWDIEFLYRVRKNRFRVLEMYISVAYGKFSTFRLKYLPGILKRLLKLRFLR